ncbi:hemagglutinin repeat-containing protein [Mannheimia indoligenes]|uniref:Hemagglutinin repeat-containing protein n=1 Tax=Mannheimia indoligenes TaxID=3103145 RepID=A0ABU7ZD10_9PAST
MVRARTLAPSEDTDNYYRLDQSAEVGNVISAKGGIRAVSGNNLTVRQSDISSESEEVLLGSRKGDVRIEAGRAEETLETGRKSTGRGLLSKTTSVHRYEHDISEAVGSNIDGRTVKVVSSSGDVVVKSSSVVGDEALTIYGKNDVSIVSDVNTHYQDELSMSKKSGLLGSGFGFTIGSKKEQVEQDRRQQSAARSQVGSLSGDTAIYAGNHYQQTGSVVTSRDGDVDILAKTATVTAARSDYESNYKRTVQQKGFTFAVSSLVTNAIQAVEKSVNSAKSVGSSKNDRINALGAVNAGVEGWRTAEQVGKLAEAISENPMQAMSQDIGLSVSYGSQKSTQREHRQGNNVEKSQVNAGGKVSIRTEGAGKDSVLTVIGSDVGGKGGTKLSSEGDVNILAIDENHLERSQNKSGGFNAGVAVQFGGAGSPTLGVTAGGNTSKGYGNGESRAWVGSRVGSQLSKTEIDSGNTANIIGSQVQGKRVEVKAKDLNIQSLQDTMSYKGKQESVQGQLTVGYGASGSVGYSNSKMNANYASVKQQAGIFAGDEGYGLDIENKVQLTGGAILSTAEKDKNQLSARTFSFTDIENHSNAKASSNGFGMGFSVGRDQKSKEDKEKNDIYREERKRNGETFEQANPNQANSSPIKFGLGENDVHSADFYALAKIGAVNLVSNTKRSESASSITSSVISDGIFNIRDVEGQENLNRITKSTVEQKNHLDKPDYQSLRKEVETDSSIKRQFFSNMAGFTDEACRTMFIAEHRMMTAEVDEMGNPIEDPKLLDDIHKEADKKGVERKEYLDEQIDKGRNIYQLREVSDQERNNLQKVTYTDPLTGKSETRYVVAFNGIFNDENAAAKFAWQNYVAKESKSGNIDSPIHKDVYFIHHPQANNSVSELLVAGYEKMFEGSFGNLLGMDNSSLQAKDIMTKYGKDNLFIGSHSRGTLTVANALSALNNKENREAKLLSDTKVKMVGPAANVTNSDNTLSQLQTGSSRNEANKAGSIRIENHKLDPVGSLPIVLGGNPSTMNDNHENRGVIQRMIDMFGDNSSMHNCYGLGQVQCIKDGYRQKGDLMMNKEQTIYDLNRNQNGK